MAPSKSAWPLHGMICMNCTVDCSMPHYIHKALPNFQHPFLTHAQHSPYGWLPPTYCATTQLTSLLDISGSSCGHCSPTRSHQHLVTQLHPCHHLHHARLPQFHCIHPVQRHTGHCASHHPPLRHTPRGSDVTNLYKGQSHSCTRNLRFLGSPTHDPSLPPIRDDPPPVR